MGSVIFILILACDKAVCRKPLTPANASISYEMEGALSITSDCSLTDLGTLDPYYGTLPVPQTRIFTRPYDSSPPPATVHVMNSGWKKKLYTPDDTCEAVSCD